MTRYEDATIRIDDDIVIIKGRGPLRRDRRINRAHISRVETFEMGLWSGRARLVGISPLRPRNWFYWDRARRHKTTAVGIDHGRFLRPTVTPDDPETVAQLLRSQAEPHHPGSRDDT